jgi:hypothetical protein
MKMIFRKGVVESSGTGKEKRMVGKVLELEKLHLIDGSGNVYTELGLSEDGMPRLFLRDKAGKVRVLLRLVEDGSPSLTFYDESGKPTWSAPRLHGYHM